MKKASLLLSFLALLIFSQAFSQMRGIRPVISPEVKYDNKVTFRLYAPEAKTVKLSGNWMAGWGTTVEMMRNDTGLYELTIDTLESELYTYTFVVNGVRTMDPGNAFIIRDGNRTESAFMVPGVTSSLYSVNEVPHGTLQKVWYPSPTLGLSRLMYVYTPAGYNESTDKLPVFYLLHGGGGDEDAWTTLGRAPQILDNLIASGKAKPMIVVMTNGNPSDAAALHAGPVKKDKGSGNPPSMGSGKFEESLVKDVIPYIEKNYRALSDKDHRAVAGLSMGGIQTMTLSNTAPEMFSYYGVMSMGLVDMARFGGKDDKESRVANLEKLRKSGVKLYWIACGKDDFLYKNAEELRKFLDEHKFPYIYRESEGGHTWTNWRLYLSELAPQLFR